MFKILTFLLALLIVSETGYSQSNNDSTHDCISLEMIGWGIFGGGSLFVTSYAFTPMHKWNPKTNKYRLATVASITAGEFIGSYLVSRSNEEPHLFRTMLTGALLGGAVSYVSWVLLEQESDLSEEGYGEMAIGVAVPLSPLIGALMAKNKSCKARSKKTASSSQFKYINTYSPVIVVHPESGNHKSASISVGLSIQLDQGLR